MFKNKELKEKSVRECSAYFFKYSSILAQKSEITAMLENTQKSLDSCKALINAYYPRPWPSYRTELSKKCSELESKIQELKNTSQQLEKGYQELEPKITRCIEEGNLIVKPSFTLEK